MEPKINQASNGQMVVRQYGAAAAAASGDGDAFDNVTSTLSSTLATVASDVDDQNDADGDGQDRVWGIDNTVSLSL